MLCICVATLCVSCTKWLDKKANLSDVTPSALKDYQALLEASAMIENWPSQGTVGSDDYYLNYSTWLSLVQASDRNAYVWASDIYEGENIPGDWRYSFQKVAYCNIVLEGLGKIQKTAQNEVEWNTIKGSALFFRAYAFYSVAQIFAKPYDISTAVSLPGIPLRLNSDVNEPSHRASVQETYDRIVKDLKEAESLLSVTAAYKHRPSKTATQALLARVYLSMQDYTNTLFYVDKAFASYNTLLDFNTVNSSVSFPFPTYQNNHPEVIFYCEMLGSSPTNINNAIIDSSLYKSYDNNDLRKSLYFRSNGSGGFLFRGSYLGRSTKFSGIAVNELYLIRSEVNSRMGNTSQAMNDLNALLQKRWKAGFFVPITVATPAEALQVIIQERRKELVFTGTLRWEDLRRLNKDLLFAKTLIRELNGQIYILPPNDNRYVYPIPEEEISKYGMVQNPR